LAAFVDATMMSIIGCLIRVSGGNYHGLVACSGLHHWDSGPDRNGISPAPARKRTTTWADFIRVHMAGTDFFSVEVLTLRGVVTYYVLFFIRLESRRVEVAGITPHPNEVWMKQIARNVTSEEWGFLDNCSYLIHDRDTKYCQSLMVENRIDGSINCKERLGGLLKYYHREAA